MSRTKRERDVGGRGGESSNSKNSESEKKRKKRKKLLLNEATTEKTSSGQPKNSPIFATRRFWVTKKQQIFKKMVKKHILIRQ